MSLAWRQFHEGQIRPFQQDNQEPSLRNTKIVDTTQRKWASEFAIGGEFNKYEQVTGWSKNRVFSSELNKGVADQGRTLARRGLRAPSRQGLKYGQIPPEIAQMKAQKVELAKAALLNHERKEVEYAFNAVFNSVSASEEMVAISNFLYDMFYHREDVHPVVLRHVSDLLLAVIPDDTTSKTEIQLALRTRM